MSDSKFVHIDKRFVELERKLSLIQQYIDVDSELLNPNNTNSMEDIIEYIRHRKAEIRRELKELD